CLGGQLLAVACGGTVAPGRHGPEIGLRSVRLTAGAADDPLLAGVPRVTGDGPPGPDSPDGPVAFEWHLDTIVDLPPGAVLLATGDTYPHQAFRVGPCAWGVQFHPEATTEDVAHWAVHGADVLAAEGLDTDALLGGLAEAGPRVEHAWRPVTERFAALVRETASARR
ncbi:MAG: type 1 glutamine amidotransferase, partial [Actinomycetes bacterium]